jgi:hypothetical protein
MSFTQDAGYLPINIEEMMGYIRANVNTQFNTSYTEDTFLGTNFYKYFYALVQRLQENEIKTAEIFTRMQEYFNLTNEKIQRPNTTHPGIFDYFQSKGYFVSTKPTTLAEAGQVFICVDVNSAASDYAAQKLAICQIIKDCVVAGVISQGTESAELTLTNGQAFTFRYNLPTKVPVLLKLTLTLSHNNQFTIASPESVKEKLLANIASKYQLGRHFEPQRYFSVLDAPWTSQVLLEWSNNAGTNWYQSVYLSPYNTVFTIKAEDVQIIEA